MNAKIDESYACIHREASRPRMFSPVYSITMTLSSHNAIFTCMRYLYFLWKLVSTFYSFMARLDPCILPRTLEETTETQVIVRALRVLP